MWGILGAGDGLVEGRGMARTTAISSAYLRIGRSRKAGPAMAVVDGPVLELDQMPGARRKAVVFRELSLMDLRVRYCIYGLDRRTRA